MLSALRSEMNKPVPDANTVAALAKKAARSLSLWADTVDRRRSSGVTDLQKSFLRLREAEAPRTAEHAFQRELALRALYRSLVDVGTRERALDWRPSLDPSLLPPGFETVIDKRPWASDR